MRRPSSEIVVTGIYQNADAKTLSQGTSRRYPYPGYFISIIDETCGKYCLQQEATVVPEVKLRCSSTVANSGE